VIPGDALSFDNLVNHSNPNYVAKCRVFFMQQQVRWWEACSKHGSVV